MAFGVGAARRKYGIKCVGCVLTRLRPWRGPLLLFCAPSLGALSHLSLASLHCRYPTLYAVPGTPRAYGPAAENKPLTGAASASEPLSENCSAEDAYAYNSVQRGHQNSVENYPIIIGLALIGWGFPIPAGFALLSWALGRIFYFTGYSSR